MKHRSSDSLPWSQQFKICTYWLREIRSMKAAHRSDEYVFKYVVGSLLSMTPRLADYVDISSYQEPGPTTSPEKAQSLWPTNLDRRLDHD